MSRAVRRRAAPVTLLALLCLACGTTRPSRFYLLSPDAGAGTPVQRVEEPAVEVGPIGFPEYLDRPQMVIRGGGELELREFDRWAEPLAENFLGVLVENLAARTGSDRVYGFGWPGGVAVDYRLTGQVTRFEVDAAGEAVLAIQWRITDAAGAVVAPARRSRFTERATPADPAAAAVALSRTVAAFSDEVAATLAGIR